MPVLSYLHLPIPEGDRERMKRELDAMLALARQQPGFRQVEVLQPLEGASAYIILSEWETLDQLRAWEHQPQHEAIIEAYQGQHTSRRYTR